jgi:tRNA A-37 threonylcarbamoyl transferase component Bud32
LDFKVKGHSNYNLKLHENVVTKSSDVDDIRLVKSALKQKEFKSNHFKSPNVIEINNDSFLMEYIQGESFSQFFTLATKRDLDGLIRKIDGYFKERIIGETTIPIQILKNKLKSLPNGDTLLPLLDNEIDIRIKVGLSHGDMTLSNMIFTDEIYLIDFLDSYIESPTMDLVKLRQDTHLHWSLNMVSSVTDLSKIKLGLSYIDDWLVKNYPIEKYELLQIINLQRIYPYTNDVKIKKYLETNINKLCEIL